MKENGTVIEIENGTAVIEMAPHKACTRCCSCRASGPRRITLSSEKVRGLKKGDKVEVEVDPALIRRLCVLLYGIPLTAFVITVLTAYAVSRSPLISFLGAVAGTIIAGGVVGCYVRRKCIFSPDVCLKERASGA